MFLLLSVSENGFFILIMRSLDRFDLKSNFDFDFDFFLLQKLYLISLSWEEKS